MGGRAITHTPLTAFRIPFRHECFPANLRDKLVKIMSEYLLEVSHVQYNFEEALAFRFRCRYDVDRMSVWPLLALWYRYDHFVDAVANTQS